MEEPVIFLFLHFAQDLSRLLRGLNLPPITSSMKVIPMKEKQDRIFGFRILIEVFWQNGKESFFLTQHFRKKGLISNQVLKPLGWLWRKKIGEFRIFIAAWMASTKGLKRTQKDKEVTNSNKPEKILTFRLHKNNIVSTKSDYNMNRGDSNAKKFL
jgi:hypothetical protein